MNQEGKELLLKDLCARLPYGVNICYIEPEYKIKSICYVDYIYPNGNIVCKTPYAVHNIENCKLFLRPVSSMTEEERKEYKHLVAFSGSPDGAANLIDWLNKKMFAYRTIDGNDMFELGLALEAPEGMYK